MNSYNTGNSIQLGQGYKNREQRSNSKFNRSRTMDRQAKSASQLAIGLTVLIAATILALVINIGLACWIGELLGNAYYGFIIIGGINAFLLFYFIHSGIKGSMSSAK